MSKNLGRKRIQLTTDTGANASAVTSGVIGYFSHMAYKPGDTGVRLDTGAVVTVTADTGAMNLPLFVAHLAPNDKTWARYYTIPVHDTGDGAIDGSAGLIGLAGEQLTVSVQGVAADTGKEADIFLYTFE